MHFGQFDFDPSSGELSGPGGINRLAPQIASVLQLLATRPGQLVTRTELRDALWPDTTVEFDQGLNFCIRQLRIALNDDADQPRYIETLPRRGYRFVAAVESDGLGAMPALAAPRRRRGPPIVLVGVSLLLVLITVALATKTSTPGNAALAIIAFDSPRGDSLLGGYSARLAEELVTEVTRDHAREIAVMGPSFTSRFPGARTNPDSVRVAIGATHILSGSVTQAREGIRVFAQLIRTSDRRHIMAIRLLDSSTSGSDARRRRIADSIARRAANITIGVSRR